MPVLPQFEAGHGWPRQPSMVPAVYQWCRAVLNAVADFEGAVGAGEAVDEVQGNVRVENRLASGVVWVDVKADELASSDEEALLRATARGDRFAFEELYRRTSPWLLLRLRRRCADENLVLEVLQDTYLAVWRAADSFTGSRSGGSGGSAAGWLWTVAARKLVDAFRQRGRDRSASVGVAPPGEAPSAEDVVLAGVLDDGQAAAWAGLSPELHSVLQAMVLDGLSVRETSVLLGVPEGTVKTRARRARLALRRGLS